MNLRDGTRRLTLLVVASTAMVGGCKGTATNGPTVEQTIRYMQIALSAHHGLRLEQLPPNDEFLARLTSDHCKITYEVTQSEAVHYDLSDIDTKTVEVKKIGDSWWVIFDTRDFNKSVQYSNPQNHSTDYEANSGGFSLDSRDVANSFARAVTHAAKLCGGSSTF